MRARIVLIALICGLLVACGDNVPATTPTATFTAPAESTPTTPIESGEPTPEEPTPEEPTPESIPEPTTEEPPQETPTSMPTIASPGTPAAIPDGPLTIVALGDSLTEGDADERGEGGYPGRLQKSIDELRPGSQVINLGKSGWDSGQMNAEQLPVALQSNPHIALVWIGSNNIWNNSGPGEGEAADLARYTNDIDTTLRALTGAGARVFIGLLDDHALRPYTTSPNGAGLSGDGLEYMSRLTNALNDATRAKAAEYGATVVDFYNTTIFTDPSTIAEDGIHPNANGYDIIAQMWLKAIRQALQ